jgi:hypothetical protein
VLCLPPRLIGVLWSREGVRHRFAQSSSDPQRVHEVAFAKSCATQSFVTVPSLAAAIAAQREPGSICA